MATLKFTVPGVPRPKARPRSSARLIYRNGKPEAIVTIHSDKEMVQLEAEVLRCFRERYPDHVPFTGPVMLRFTAVFPVPASWPKAAREAALAGRLYHTNKPDKDNIEKLIVDALTPPSTKPGKPPASPHGFAWIDDGQVQGGGVKRYGSVARVDVELSSLVEPDVPPSPAMKRAEEALSAAGSRQAPRRAKKKPTKSLSNEGAQQAFDLSGHTPRQRDLIQRALDREASTRPASRGLFGKDGK